MTENVKVNIYELKNLMQEVARSCGLNREEAKIVVEDYWEAELMGKLSHGVSKFCWEVKYFNERRGPAKIIIDKGAVILIDSNKEIGQVATKFSVEMVIERAKKYGIALVGMKNCQRYGILARWVKLIAENDLIGIILNSCEPATTAYGGKSKVLGTNPIAIGIPSAKYPIILDMATSKVAMSLIWRRLIENRKLPVKTFFDSKGNYTTDPLKVKSVEVFGGYKGYGLSLVIQILSGSLLTAKMGFAIKTPYDIGYYFQAIDPSVFQDLGQFKKENERLIKEIKSSKRKRGVDEILIPGEKSSKKFAKALKSGFINIHKNVWSELVKRKQQK
jgi:LDH2 family malate/lactate/ureidoglycolate dehydrogenase